MKQLCASGELAIFAHQVAQATPVSLPFHDRAFACLLWDHGLLPSTEGAGAFIASLIRSGCRYFVCGGGACEAWHDLVDEVFVEQHLNSSDEERERALVMTTWHTNESPSDVAFFFVFNTSFNNVVLDRYLVLHLGVVSETAAIDDSVISQFRARITES